MTAHKELDARARYIVLFDPLAITDQRGDLVTARKHYEACVATKVTEYVEYTWARARLKQLAETADKPGEGE